MREQQDGFVSWNCNFPIPIAITAAGNPAGRHPLRSARHEKNSNRKLEAVRQRQPHVLHVGRIHDGLYSELAHAARLLGAQQVALARTPAHKFPGGVILKRLAAPRCVFNFIFLFFFTISSFYLLTL